LLGSNHNQTFSQSAAPSFARLFSPYIGFVNLDQSRKAISSGSDHGAPQFMEPGPCREITAKSEQSLQTQRTCHYHKFLENLRSCRYDRHNEMAGFGRGDAGN
jgi:hypothetical protein